MAFQQTRILEIFHLDERGLVGSSSRSIEILYLLKLEAAGLIKLAALYEILLFFFFFAAL